MDGESAESVVKELRSFAKIRTSGIEYYVPLAGVAVVDAVSLGSDIDLIPWAEVPDSEQKTRFSQEVSIPPQNFAPFTVAATCAIRICLAERQILFSLYEFRTANDFKTAIDAPGSLTTAQYERTKDVVRCITALSAQPAAAIGSWSRFNQKIANDFIGPSSSFSGALFESAAQAASSKPVTLDGKSIARLIERFDKLKPSEKEVMRVALDRLGQALRRPSVIDKAIDLGIALEVMLLHGIGANDRGELRYRSSIRGATFLGGTNPERLKTFRLLKEVYDLRSKAVHSGVLKKEKKRPPPEQILEEAIGTCAAIARKLIDRGSLPEWDSEYVIGGEQ